MADMGGKIRRQKHGYVITRGRGRLIVKPAE
jgi:hypothetical protein